MKNRIGYVSNSSSSSFVCLGIDITDNPELKSKFLDVKNYELSKEGEKLLPKHTEYNYYENNGSSEIIGWVLGYGSDSEGTFTCEEIDFDELKKYAEDLEKATGIRPKVMGGIYAS